MSAPPPSNTTVVAELSAGGGVKRLLGGRKGDHRITLTPAEIVVEHAGMLRAPLRFAPGSVVVATVDPGPANLGKDTGRGRFPILRRLGINQVVPREVGIEGWLWTNLEGSAFTVLTDDAPNLAFVFSPPVAAERLEEALPPAMLEEVAKRSPLGQPALFGLLLRVADALAFQNVLERYGLRGDVTDREVPPTQRRHLPDDKPANPSVDLGQADRSKSSMPPPGGH